MEWSAEHAVRGYNNSLTREHMKLTRKPWWRRRRRYGTSFVGRRRKCAVARCRSTIAPRRFFQRYVSQRKPVILCGHIPELASLPNCWWASQHLHGDEIQAEVRDGPRDVFGKGRRTTMRYGELLQRIAGGDTTHYLTTQESSGDRLLSPPLTALASRLPLRPRLLGALVPQSINLWLGRTDDLTSSGLHHDYHDNLYVLLQGRKRFRLFPPSDAHLMQTVGTIATVHANGRICYVGEETAADGRTPEEEADEAADEAVRVAKRHQQHAEQVLAEAEETAQGVELAEEALEDAMDQVMAAEERRRRLRRRRTSAGQDTNPSVQKPMLSRWCDDMGAPAVVTPPNFSRLGALETDAAGRLPAALGGAHLLECELKAGEMLYLPAGWFHEVRSEGEHCALNYWYHPPDALEYKRPYKAHDFWQRDWRSTLQRERQ